MARVKRTSLDAADRHMHNRAAVDWPSNASLPDDPTDREVLLGTYADIIATRSASDWTRAETAIAASLARQILQLDLATAAVMKTGGVIKGTGSKGQPIVKISPFVDVQSRLSSSVASMATKLGLFAKQRADQRSVAAHEKAAPARMDTMAEAPMRWKDRPQ